VPAATTHCPPPSRRRVDARHCARLPALIASLSSPDREIVLLRVVAGVSIPRIVAALGVTPAAICLAEDQALELGAAAFMEKDGHVLDLAHMLRETALL